MRIDKELVNRNLVTTRSKAQELIRNGHVLCNNKKIKKESFQVKEEDILEILKNNTLKYVSRGGLKLEKAIKSFNLNFENKNIMDIGSSTGGFTDCALKNKANSVLAIDVGTNLLDPTLRNNKKITLLEQTNFKTLENNHFENIDYIVADVSFISLKLLIDKIYSEDVNTELIFLIKPQFECGKEIADKYKGIILNKKIHLDILNNLTNYFKEKEYNLQNITNSPIKGGNGNIEYISHFNKNKPTKYFNFETIIENAFK